MNSSIDRVLGATLLRADTYEEVEADRRSIVPATAVVVASAVAAGVGSFGVTAGRPAVLAVISVLALLVWGVWAYLTYEIGARFMPTDRTSTDIGELLRTLGFASAPGMLRVFGLIPGATTAVFALTELWMLAAMVVAVRQALDYTSTARAAVVCGLAWIVAVALGLVLGAVFVPTVS